MNALIIIDVQNDFVTGSLGTNEAELMIPKLCKKLNDIHNNVNQENGFTRLFFTMDSHNKGYSYTLEGKNLPIKHCIQGTQGWQIVDELKPFIPFAEDIFIKNSFGCKDFLYVDLSFYNKIELCGLCTDICVITNALFLKTKYPNIPIYVDSTCCAGTSPEMHEKALQVMKQCQIEIF